MMKSETNKFLGTWGRHGSIWKQKNNSLHPEDREKIILFPYKMTLGLIFFCIKENEDYLTLKYGDILIRVKHDSYFPIPQQLKFDIGDWVYVKEEPLRKGVIYEIQWHRNNKKPMFFIKVNGTRKSTRRYWEEELDKIEK